MADDKRPVILIANSDPVEGVNLAKQVEDYFYGTYRIHTVSTKSDATKISQILQDPSKPNLVASLIDEQLDNALVRVGGAATFNVESQRALEKQLYDAALLAPQQSAVIVKGMRETREVMTIMRFLRLNSVTYNQVEQLPPPNVKVEVTLPDQKILNDPTLITLSTELKLMRIAKPVGGGDDKYECDVAVVGGGPAGLSAAVNLAALYGKTPLIIEEFAPGGAAATATNIINNYLGFPDGIQAAELAALWKKHADKFKIDWLPDYRVTDVNHVTTGSPSHPFVLTVAENNKDRDPVATLDQQVAAKEVTTKQVAAKKILLACGIELRKQGGINEGNFAGQGVYYDALTGDAALYKGNTKLNPVAIIGGGDTAGTAAIMFAEAGIYTTMIIRNILEDGDMLKVNSDQIKDSKHASYIDVKEKTEVIKYYGPEKRSDGYLTTLVIGPTGTKDEFDVRSITIGVAAAYVLIGASGLDKTMQTWLGKVGVKFNDDGVETSAHTQKPPRFNMTDVAGVFVAGDARAGSVRRISEAVGDGGSASLGIYNDF